jgi:tRNA(Ile)-lysidine synthetase-like protein
MRPYEEAIKDADFLREYCSKNNLHFDQFSIEARDVEDRPPGEGEYREARYTEIAAYAKAIDYRYAATGHHADDQLETMIMKMCRGSGLRGFSGIAPSLTKQNIHYVRPLLEISKDAIMEICAKNDVPFIQDASNEDQKYARNYIRANVVPHLKKIYPRCAEKSVMLGDNLSQAQKVIERQLYLLQEYEISPTQIGIAALQLSHDIVIYEWLRKACNHLDFNFVMDSLNKTEIAKVILAIKLRERKTFMLAKQIKVRICFDVVKVF